MPFIAPAYFESCGIDTPLGVQPGEGYRFLLKLDLDSHGDEQNADDTLAFLRAALPRLFPNSG